jgi:hypothetical protein
MQGETMKSAIRSATLVAFFIAALPVALGFAVKAQTNDTPNAGLPGGHPHSDFTATTAETEDKPSEPRNPNSRPLLALRLARADS